MTLIFYYSEYKLLYKMNYLWYVCPKCKDWKNSDRNRIRLPYNLEEIQIKRYWTRICDSCKIEYLKENREDLIKKLEKDREVLVNKMTIINEHINNITL